MSVVASNLLAVDVGNQFFKAAVVGTGTFDVVMNQQSKRKTVSMVSFAGDIRSFGDEASRDFGRAPSKVPSHFRWLVGAGGSPATLRLPNAEYYPYELSFNESSSSTSFLSAMKASVADNSTSLTSEESLAHVLAFARQIGEEHTGKAVDSLREVILTVSSSATMRERQAWLDAAKIAGFVRASLVHETPVAFVQKALGMEITNTTSVTVLILNVGSSHTEACVGRIVGSASNSTKTPITTQVSILGCAESFGASGEKIDEALAGEMREAFVKKYPKKKEAFLKDPRAQLRLVRQAEATKLHLSANKDAVFYVEGLFDDMDFSQKISRARLEELANPVIENVLFVAQDALKVSGIEKADIIEVIGGGWRVPKILAELQAKFGEIGQRLNGDESPVMGAAFVGASELTGVRLAKKVSFNDISAHEYVIKISKDDTVKSQTLIPKGHKFGAKKLVKTPSDGTPFFVQLVENGKAIDRFDISGIEEKSPGHISLRFEFDNSGIVKFTSAEWEGLPRSDPETIPEMSNETVSINSTVIANPLRIVLHVTRTTIAPHPFSTDDVLSMNARFLERVARDRAALARLASKNEFEAAIYATREKLSDKESILVSTEFERETVSELVKADESWLYSSAAGLADREEFSKRLIELKKSFSAISERVSEMRSRKGLADLIDSTIKEVRDGAELVLSNRTWVPKEVSEKLLNDTIEFEIYWREVSTKQEATELTDDPVFKVVDVKRKLATLGKEVKRLLSIKKPVKEEKKKKSKKTEPDFEEMMKSLNITMPEGVKNAAEWLKTFANKTDHSDNTTATDQDKSKDEL